MDLSGDLQSWITRDYSKKPPSTVTTRCDEENQVFLTMDGDHLKGPFTSPHYLSVNGSSDVTLVGKLYKIDASYSGTSIYIVDYAYGNN